MFIYVCEFMRVCVRLWGGWMLVCVVCMYVGVDVGGSGWLGMIELSM